MCSEYGSLELTATRLDLIRRILPAQVRGKCLHDANGPVKQFVIGDFDINHQVAMDGPEQDERGRCYRIEADLGRSACLESRRASQ